MRLKHMLCGFATCAAMATGPALSDTPIGYREGGKALFVIDVPDFWTARVGGPRVLTPPGEESPRDVARVIGLSPEGADGIWMGFVVPVGLRNLAEGADYMREIGPHLVKDPVVSQRKNRKIGGRDALTISGNGRRNGKSVHFTAVLIDLPHNRIAFSVTVLEKGYDNSVLEDVNDVYASFRAIGQGG